MSLLCKNLAIEEKQQESTASAKNNAPDQSISAEIYQADDKTADPRAENTDENRDKNADESFAITGIFAGHNPFSEKSDDETNEKSSNHYLSGE